MQSKVYIAGHTGMVGSSIKRELEKYNYRNFLTADSSTLDLRNQSDVREFFKKNQPEIVIIAAAKVGGIQVNSTLRGEFIYDNLIIELNIIHASYLFGVKKLIFLGSSCIYPKLASQPLKEESLLTGELEQTNEPYAIAKIAGIKLCESYYKQYGCNFLSIMPTNLYGYNDNFDLQSSHVLPALINKFHNAKISKNDFVTIWGSGKPLREFLFVDDLSSAIRFVLENIEAENIYSLGISHLNIGSSIEISIKDLSLLVSNIVGFNGSIKYDNSKPDGTPRKLMDNARINKLGWHSTTDLQEGISKTYNWYKNYVCLQ